MMKGFPKHFNTKEDYLYIKENFPKEQWLPVWEALYNDRIDNFNRGELAEGEAGVTDATHFVSESEDMGKTVRYQYEKAVNPTAHIFRIGFTEEEVKAVIDAARGE